MRTRIKICCISSIEEAKLAIGMGADAIGLVAKMPSGPGPIPDSLIKEIANVVPPPIATFLLSSEQSVKEIIKHVIRTGANTVQLVDELTNGQYEDIRNELPFLRIVQVIHVTGDGSIDQARKIQNEVHSILLDSGNPKAEIKTLGGTGNVHNWEISREIVRSVTVPVFLAGGLNAVNVRKAIDMVGPYGVDVCSGVRTNGILDTAKLKSFIDEVNRR